MGLPHHRRMKITSRIATRAAAVATVLALAPAGSALAGTTTWNKSVPGAKATVTASWRFHSWSNDQRFFTQSFYGRVTDTRKDGECAVAMILVNDKTGLELGYPIGACRGKGTSEEISFTLTEVRNAKLVVSTDP